MRKTLIDTKTMFWRNMIQTLRTPDALIMSIVIPGVIMLIFVNVFGGSLDVGDYNFTNFIVPGILVNSIIQALAYTGISVNQDLTSGIINRFRSMSISKSSILTAHVLVATLKTIATTIVILTVAYFAGFRPTASLTEWISISALILLFILSISWVAAFFGAALKSADSVAGMMAIIALFVFLSPGMAPTETMPRFLRYFAENQPMSPFINSIRALMNGKPIEGNDLILTLAWWGGILVVTFLATNHFYKKKLTV